MQKNRTSAPLLRGVRQGIALFLTAVALWIVYLTADPAVALEKLKQLAQLDQLTAALVNLELPWDTQPPKRPSPRPPRNRRRRKRNRIKPPRSPRPKPPPPRTASSPAP